MKAVPDINIGAEIKKKFDSSKMTQREFGARIGMPQSNVGRVFNSESIDTKRLVAVCAALDFNFFSLYCPDLELKIRTAGRDYNETDKIEHHGPEYHIESGLSGLSDKEQIQQLKSQLADKDMIIKLLQEKCSLNG